MCPLLIFTSDWIVFFSIPIFILICGQTGRILLKVIISLFLIFHTGISHLWCEAICIINSFILVIPNFFGNLFRLKFCNKSNWLLFIFKHIIRIVKLNICPEFHYFYIYFKEYLIFYSYCKESNFILITRSLLCKTLCNLKKEYGDWRHPIHELVNDDWYWCSDSI